MTFCQIYCSIIVSFCISRYLFKVFLVAKKSEPKKKESLRTNLPNPLPQIVQRCVFSPVWYLSCTVRSVVLGNPKKKTRSNRARLRHRTHNLTLAAELALERLLAPVPPHVDHQVIVPYEPLSALGTEELLRVVVVEFHMLC